MTTAEQIAARTFHGRHGDPANRFSYGVDYMLFDPEAELNLPALISRNRPNLVSLRDKDHGGAPGAGQGARWVRDVLGRHGLSGCTDGHLLLMAQPRVIGHVFNPVSFWLCHDRAGALRAVIAEVNNTFGDRHSYLCHNDDLSPITAKDSLVARKVFHVSPFQPVEGAYSFRFGICPDRIDIAIDYHREGGGLLATLSGKRRPASNARVLSALMRRPFGSRRVLGLIHWQAVKLWWKRARFHSRPTPPADELSR